MFTDLGVHYIFLSLEKSASRALPQSIKYRAPLIHYLASEAS